MRKIYIIFTLLLGLIITPSLLYAQTNTSEDSSLEQITPEQLQQVEEILGNMENAPATNQNVSYANDFQLDIIWKTNTLIPYDYPGKALPGVASRITFYAIANVPNPNNLVYTWIIDDASSTRDGPELSGVGNDIFSMITYRIPNYTHKIKLVAQDPKTENSASINLDLNTVMPEALFYVEINNNYGKSTSDTTRMAQGSENNIMARIFNINASSFSNLNMKWFFNNIQQENNNTRQEIIPLNISSNSPPGSQAYLKLEAVNRGIKDEDYTQKATVKTSVYVTKADQ